MLSTRLMFCAAAAVCSLTFPLAAQKPAPVRPLLDGSWSLNRELSAPPRGGSLPEPDDGLSRRGGRPMSGFDGGGRGDRQDYEERQRRRDLVREVLEAPQRFIITTEDPTIIFTFPDGRVVRYEADGNEERHQFSSGTVKTRTRWQADGLAIETDLGEGLKVTHTYKTRREEPRQLVVTTHVPRRARDLPPITHTYDETLP